MPPRLPGLPSAGTLERELDHHFSNVQDLYDRVIHSQRPLSYSRCPSRFLRHEAASEPEHADAPQRAEFPSVNLSRYLEQRAPSFLAMLIARRHPSQPGQLRIVSRKVVSIRSG